LFQANGNQYLQGQPLFSGFTIPICGENVVGGCGVVSACSQAVLGAQR